MAPTACVLMTASISHELDEDVVLTAKMSIPIIFLGTWETDPWVSLQTTKSTVILSARTPLSLVSRSCPNNSINYEILELRV